MFNADGDDMLCMNRNVLQYLNGTELECRDISVNVASEMIVGVKGIINDDEFNKQIVSPCSGAPAHRQSYDLNSSSFPYWSSPALTNALTVQVLVKYSNLMSDSVIAEPVAVQ